MSASVLTRRRDLRRGGLVSLKEVLPIGHMSDVQLDCIDKEAQQEVLGLELDPNPLYDWLNPHIVYNFALQGAVDHTEITLCRNFGEEGCSSTYPLNRVEWDALREKMEAYYQLRTGRTLAQHYSHLLAQEEVESPELMVGTRRTPVDEVSLTGELSECDGLLQFYVPVAFAPGAVSGIRVVIVENDGWLNVYTTYNLSTGKSCSALDVTLVCGNSSEFAFRYPLAEREQAALLGKMDAYCREQIDMVLANLRARYLMEEPQSRQVPSLAQLQTHHRSRARLVQRVQAEGGPGSHPARKLPR